LAAELVGLVRWRVLALVALALAAAAGEGVGILLLVPLLALVGVDPGGGATGRMAALAERALEGVGVEPSLPAVLGAFVLTVWVLALVRRSQSILQGRTVEGLSHRLRTRLHAAVTRSDWSFFTGRRQSDVLHALTDEVDRAALAAYLMVGLVAEGLVSLLFVAIAFRLSPPATGVALVCGVGVLLLLRSRIARAHRIGAEVGEAGATVVAGAVEHLAALKVAKSYGAGERHVRAFAAHSGALAASSVEGYRNHADVELRFRVGSAALAAVVIYAALAWLDLPAAAVLLLLVLFSRLAPRLSSLASTVQSLLGALPGYERVERLTAEFEAAAEQGGKGEARAPAGTGAGSRSGEGVSPISLRHDVRCRGLRFAYPGGAGRPALHGADLLIPAGGMTALVGPSGAGKSTLADLLLGLLAPDAGEILVDGTPLRPQFLPRWRETVAYVPQDTFLFHDTIRENLLWARPGAPGEEVDRALRLARADGFVSRLPQGLETVVGDRGVQLSGGERQRIALARALLRRPSLLVLDEATSALDQESEEAILEALAALRGELTILLITHRLSAVRNADLIHVMDAGRVVESGRWEELMAGSGRLVSFLRIPVYETSPPSRR
jgi:ATP-binding cassette subfamily C protein